MKRRRLVKCLKTCRLSWLCEFRYCFRTQSSACDIYLTQDHTMHLPTSVSLVYFAFVHFAMAVKSKHFECGPQGEFIPYDWMCDGLEDCSTGIDEVDCDSITECGAHEWLCEDGNLCVDEAMMCNSHDDCLDGSDENSTLCATYAPFCPMNTIKCDEDQQCVSVKKRCDGVKDCSNGYDERHCFVVACDPVDEFSCKQGECINRWFACDKKQDCLDGSDEDPVMCSMRTTTVPPAFLIHTLPEAYCSDVAHHKCGTGECINLTLVCDKVNHCPDGSDESDECEIACQNNGGCGHICHPTPTGPRCSCRPGHLLDKETKICQDENECNQVPLLCSQHCINTPGSFICSCETGYTLEHNKRFCRVSEGRPDILYVEGPQIKHLQNLGHMKHVGVKASVMVGQITAFDYDIKTGNIYWTCSKSSYVHVTGPVENRSVIHGVTQCEGLAVDWIGRSIYYIDGDKRLINVCGMSATYTGECLTVVRNLEDKPKFIVLDPSVGRMFWCDDGHSPRIERAHMTGRMREAIVTSDIARPMALTLDMAQRRVYWLDSHLNRIESVDYKGHFRLKVVESPFLHAYGLHLFEDFLYWSNKLGIYQAHKLYTNSTSDINKLIGVTMKPGVVKAMHNLTQTNVNDACLKKNPTCSHYCLLNPIGGDCGCPNFMEKASAESHDCIEIDCQNGGTPMVIDIMDHHEVQCSCPVGFGGAKCDNKTGVMFSYPLLAKNNYAWVAGVLCVLVLSIASIIFGIYCCRRKRDDKEIISIIKFRQAAAKTQNAMMDASHRTKSESTQILVEQSAFENPAYHQEEDENANNEKGTLVVMSASNDSIDSAFLIRQDSVETDLSARPLTVSENYDSS